MVTRFTSGEYTLPAPWRGLNELRVVWSYVLAAIERLAPEVLETLRQQVYPAFKKAAGNDPLGIASVTLVEELTKQQPVGPVHIQQLHDRLVNSRLHERLVRWANRWHLKEPTFLDMTLETMTNWRYSDPRFDPFQGLPWKRPSRSCLKQFCWTDCKPFEAKADSRQVEFHANGWHPLDEKRTVASKRILDELTRQVRAYLDSVEQRARGAGLVEAPTKTNDEHFEWFVKYQVLGKSLSDIDPIDPPAVSRAVNGIGKLLSGPSWKQWKRAPAKAGPRPK